MIPEAIGSLLMTAVLTVVGALPLPDVTIPTFGPLIGFVKTMDDFVPVSEVLDYMLTMLRVVVVLLGFKALIYVYHLIPLKSS